MAFLHHNFLDNRAILLLENLSNHINLVVNDVLQSVQFLISQLFFVEHQKYVNNRIKLMNTIQFK